MIVLKVDPRNPDVNVINIAADYIAGGKVVVLPTDTCYGLCADIFNISAVHKIIKIKKRKDKPMPIFVSDIYMANHLVDFDGRSKRFFNRYMPGQITMVLKKKKAVSGVITAGRDTVGIRIPDYPLIQKIIARLQGPITGTSANVTDKNPAYSIPEAENMFKGGDLEPDLAIDTGELIQTSPSTVVDFSIDEPRVIRQGSKKIVLKVEEK